MPIIVRSGNATLNRIYKDIGVYFPTVEVVISKSSVGYLEGGMVYQPYPKPGRVWAMHEPDKVAMRWSYLVVPPHRN